MPRLVVAPCRSASQLRRALSPGQADEYGTPDGDVLVADEETAERLVAAYPNVRYAADADESEDATDGETPRMVADNDGVEYRCGVNDCSRSVDGPDAACWQHDDTAE